ncbi:MAG: DUF4384 domain-containing protein [Planctomycetota bacterium]|jgi:hypothetical protein|nr:DUF4384 domain-containing protein [Planctomycetota bacterium]
MNRVLNFVLLVSAVTALTGLQGAEPEWLREAHAGYPFEKFFAGSGSVPFRKGDDREKAKQQAYDKALAALSREISVEVKSLSKDFLRTFVHGDKEDSSAVFEESIAVFTRNKIQLTRITNDQVWKRAFRADEYCVRVVLDRTDMAKRLRGSLAEKRLQGQRHFDAAQKALVKADLTAALRHLVQARLARTADYGTEALWRTVSPKASAKELPGPSLGDISSSLEKVSSTLQIRHIRGEGQPIRQGGKLLEPLVIQVVLKAGVKELPVAGLPISFSFHNATGQMAGGIQETDAKGQASAKVTRLAPDKGANLATVRAGVALAELVKGFTTEEREQAQEWLSPLERRVAVFSFRPPPKWEAWLKALAATIKSELALHNHRSIVLGSFSLGGERAVGPFGDSLRQGLAKELQSNGITITQWGSKRVAPVLWGEYSVEKDLVDVDWQVVRRDQGSGNRNQESGIRKAETAIASGNRRLLREQLPGVKFGPPALEKIRARLAQIGSVKASTERGALRVEVWTNHGPRPVYQAGEEMKVFLKANRACNIQLIYTDSDGVSFFILPNASTGRSAQAALEADKVRMVPDTSRGERWRLRFSAEGKGLETLAVVGSTGGLAMPEKAADYPVYAFGFRLEGISLRDQILKSQAGRKATARALVMIHQER